MAHTPPVEDVSIWRELYTRSLLKQIAKESRNQVWMRGCTPVRVHASVCTWINACVYQRVHASKRNTGLKRMNL